MSFFVHLKYIHECWICAFDSASFQDLSQRKLYKLISMDLSQEVYKTRLGQGLSSFSKINKNTNHVIMNILSASYKDNEYCKRNQFQTDITDIYSLELEGHDPP